MTKMWECLWNQEVVLIAQPSLINLNRLMVEIQMLRMLPVMDQSEGRSM